MSSDAGLGKSALDALLGGLASDLLRALKSKTSTTKTARTLKEKLGSGNENEACKHLIVLAVALAEDQAPLSRPVRNDFLRDAHNKDVLINWIIDSDHRDPKQFRLITKNRKEKNVLEKFIARLPSALDQAFALQQTPGERRQEAVLEKIL